MTSYITTSNISWYIGLLMYPKIRLLCFNYHRRLQAAVRWYCWLFLVSFLFYRPVHLRCNLVALARRYFSNVKPGSNSST